MFTGMLSLRSASQDSVAVRRVKSAGRGTPSEAPRLVAIRSGKRHASQRHDSLRGITLHAQARQDSNLQPPGLAPLALAVHGSTMCTMGSGSKHARGGLWVV